MEAIQGSHGSLYPGKVLTFENGYPVLKKSLIRIIFQNKSSRNAWFCWFGLKADSLDSLIIKSMAYCKTAVTPVCYQHLELLQFCTKPSKYSMMSFISSLC